MKTLSTLMWCIIAMQMTYSQSLEIGLFGGISNYIGDLQQTKFELNTIGKAGGVFVRYNVTTNLALQSHLYKGSISGNDGNYIELTDIRDRNLSFRSDIWEMGVQAEFTFLSFGEKDQRIAAPYIFTGISYFHFNPQAYYNNEWIDLQPLGTEGQNLDNQKYDLFQFAIPVGIGFNIQLTSSIKLGFELGFRKTFTDYLDDISGYYPDIEALRAENEMSALLSYRSPELDNYAVGNPEGQLRGSQNGDDFYFFGGLLLSTTICKYHKLKKSKKTNFY